MSEYDKAKGYSIKDLDKETYVKFDNKYILNDTVFFLFVEPSWSSLPSFNISSK